jgi:hypothetical protein
VSVRRPVRKPRRFTGQFANRGGSQIDWPEPLSDGTFIFLFTTGSEQDKQPNQPIQTSLITPFSLPLDSTHNDFSIRRHHGCIGWCVHASFLYFIDRSRLMMILIDYIRALSFVTLTAYPFFLSSSFFGDAHASVSLSHACFFICPLDEQDESPSQSDRDTDDVELPGMNDSFTPHNLIARCCCCYEGHFQSTCIPPHSFASRLFSVRCSARVEKSTCYYHVIKDYRSVSREASIRGKAQEILCQAEELPQVVSRTGV